MTCFFVLVRFLLEMRAYPGLHLAHTHTLTHLLICLPKFLKLALEAYASKLIAMAMAYFQSIFSLPLSFLLLLMSWARGAASADRHEAFTFFQIVWAAAGKRDDFASAAARLVGACFVLLASTFSARNWKTHTCWLCAYQDSCVLAACRSGDSCMPSMRSKQAAAWWTV